MKLHKTVRQCLATALITSSILESSALPIQSAPSPDQPDSSTPSEQEAQPTAEALLPVQPAIEQSASPEASTALPARSEASPASNPITPPATPDQPTRQATPNAAEAIAPAVNPEPIAPRAETIRQALAARLAAIVERDKPQRESQLRQNLVAAALHYAQAGEIDRARQTAKNPALPIDLQTETLAKIDAIAALPPEQSAPTAPIVLSPSRQPIPRSLAATAQVPDRWVLPASPEWSPYAGDRCLPRFAPAPLPTSIGAMRLPTLSKITEAQPSATQPMRAASEFISSVKRATSEKTASAQKVERHENREAQKATPLQIDRASGLGSASQAMAATGLRGTDLAPPSPLKNRLSAPLIPTPLKTTLGRQADTALDEDFSAVAIPIALEAIEAPAFAAPLPKLQPDAIVNLDFSVFSAHPFVVIMPTTFAAAANFSNSLFGSVQFPSLPAVSVAATPNPAIGRGATPAGLRGSDGCSGSPQLPLRAANSLLARSLTSLGMMFPLPIPAAITSLFGWRVHPITGDRRFHAGVDLGAPMGTPILAALPGRVVVADYEGGYGLTIVIENGGATERNLYGHLSAIAVHPGDIVPQGSIIGWVGSTGNSTGPHLHFETQLPIGGTWQAVNPLATNTASR